MDGPSGMAERNAGPGARNGPAFEFQGIWGGVEGLIHWNLGDVVVCFQCTGFYIFAIMRLFTFLQNVSHLWP